MTASNEAVGRFLCDALLSGLSASELFALVERERIDSSTVLAILKDPSLCLPHDMAAELDDLVTFDVAYEVVEHFGAQRAQELTSRLRAWEDVHLVRHHAEVRAYWDVRADIVRRDPIELVYARFRSARLSDAAPAWLLHEMIQAYPLRELVALTPTVSESHAQIIGARLRRQHAPLVAFDQLIDVVADAQILLAFERYWNVVPLRHHNNPDSAAMAVFAQLHVAGLRPIASLIPFAEKRGDVAWWLPLLRDHGLKGGQAALQLLEQGGHALDVAKSLAGAGYDDDAVLVALLENGVGTRRTLELLRDSGWNTARMAHALHHQGALLPELRSYLEDLGVAPSHQRTLALEHWDVDVVDVVFASMKRLPSASAE